MEQNVYFFYTACEEYACFSSEKYLLKNETSIALWKELLPCAVKEVVIVLWKAAHFHTAE